MEIDRRHFLEAMTALGFGATLLPGALYSRAVQEQELTTETIARAAKLIGLEFTPEQRELMLEDLRERLESFRTLRDVDLPNDVIPALLFDPAPGGSPPEATGRGAVAPETAEADGRAGEGVRAEDIAEAVRLPDIERPARDEDVAYLTVPELASLLRSGQLGSVELTRLYLTRLRRHDPALHAVVTLTEERALDRARRADAELEAGEWRGPLHGIPWGAKDLLAVEGYPTTWGATPYREQVIDHTAAVVRRLDEAGAVLVAKLSLGALAWGDVWFGGRTRNPWNVDQGSSGSSAGPGAAVAAGLVGFAVGSETLGSIVSPSTRNGVTGHRPTFGRVSRDGAMTLSWSMDKLGPMCRSAAGCALVFSAIHGRDPADPTTVTAPFPWTGEADLDGLRVGFLEEAFRRDEEDGGDEEEGGQDEQDGDGDGGGYRNYAADRATLRTLRGLGVDLRPLSLPDIPSGPLLLTLNAEAAAAFEKLTRSGGVETMVRQEQNAWPNVFRHARFIPAVEYINANRVRTKLMSAMAEAMTDLDVFVSPSFRGGTLGVTNLTGHPSVTVPNAFHRVEDAPAGSPRRAPGSITFIGALYRDDAALALAHAYQGATDFHRRRPPIR